MPGEAQYPAGTIGRQWQDQRDEGDQAEVIELEGHRGRRVILPEDWARLFRGPNNSCRQELEGQLGGLLKGLEYRFRRDEKGDPETPNNWPDKNSADADEQAAFEYITKVIVAYCCCRKRVRELEDVNRRLQARGGVEGMKMRAGEEFRAARNRCWGIADSVERVFIRDLRDKIHYLDYRSETIERIAEHYRENGDELDEHLRGCGRTVV